MIGGRSGLSNHRGIIARPIPLQGGKSMDLQSYSAYLVSFLSVGSFVIIDLIAATTNALNGALLAQRPDYYKGRQWTIVGILILAIFGGIGGGVSPRRTAEQSSGRADEPLVPHLVRAGWYRGDADLLQGGAEVPRDVLPVHDRLLAALVRSHRGGPPWQPGCPISQPSRSGWSAPPPAGPDRPHRRQIGQAVRAK